MATPIEFMDIMQAIQDDDEDQRIREFIRGFRDDVEAGIERHDFAEYREALAIRQATDALWEMVHHGYIAEHVVAVYGEHPRWQEWPCRERYELVRSIRGELQAA